VSANWMPIEESFVPSREASQAVSAVTTDQGDLGDKSLERDWTGPPAPERGRHNSNSRP
jgi:hypothetical protein